MTTALRGLAVEPSAGGALDAPVAALVREDDSRHERDVGLEGRNDQGVFAGAWVEHELVDESHGCDPTTALPSLVGPERSEGPSLARRRHPAQEALPTAAGDTSCKSRVFLSERAAVDPFATPLNERGGR
jgi:hypothetical protein